MGNLHALHQGIYMQIAGEGEMAARDAGVSIAACSDAHASTAAVDLADRFQLPDEASMVLFKLLLVEETKSFTLASPAARASYFQCWEGLHPLVMTFPPTYADSAHAILTPRLLGDPLQAASKFVHISRLWHLNRLQDPKLRAVVQGVKVFTLHPTKAFEASMCATMCTQVHFLPYLRTLDLRGTTLEDLTGIAAAQQLTMLHIGRLRVSTTTPLANLTELTALSIDDSLTADLLCIKNLLKLERLQVAKETVIHRRRHHVDMTKVLIPPLGSLRKLQNLDLCCCRFDRALDLISGARTLKHLVLKSVEVNQFGLDGVGSLSLQELVSAPRALSRVSRIYIKDTFLDPTLDSLHARAWVLDLSLPLRELHIAFSDIWHSIHDVRNFSFLFHLPLLTKLHVSEPLRGNRRFEGPAGYVNRQIATNEARSLAGTLKRLQKLKCLDYEGFITASRFLPELHQLEELALRNVTPPILNFKWIPSYQSLRKLTLVLDSSNTNFSAIGELSKNLRELDYTDTGSLCAYRSNLSFLSRLRNLKILKIVGKHTHGLLELRGHEGLEHLTISSGCLGKDTTEVAVLSSLTSLHELDISSTTITDISSLTALRALRQLSVSLGVDSAPIAGFVDHPTLRQIKCGHYDLLADMVMMHKCRALHTELMTELLQRDGDSTTTAQPNQRG